MIKKGSALLMILLIITILGAVALTLSRSIIAGVGFTTNISDSMAAEQASKAGLELGLLHMDDGTTFPVSQTIDTGHTTFTVNRTDQDDGSILIESTGQSGTVIKKHQITKTTVSPFFTGKVKTITGGPLDYLDCNKDESIPRYVAIGAGHTYANATDQDNRRASTWLKCQELQSGLSLNFTTVSEGPLTLEYDDIFPKSYANNLVVTKVGHSASNPNGNHPYYREYFKVYLATLVGATINYYNNFNDHADVEASITDPMRGQKSCPQGWVMIADGHQEYQSYRPYLERELIRCAPINPQ